MSQDHGNPVHYTAIEQGTPVYDNSGQRVGEIEQVADNYTEHILDGFVIADGEGAVRFVDAPEVARTLERGVMLTIDAAAVAELPPPDKGAGSFGPNRSSGKLSKLFGGAWRKR